MSVWKRDIHVLAGFHGTISTFHSVATVEAVQRVLQLEILSCILLAAECGITVMAFSVYYYLFCVEQSVVVRVRINVDLFKILIGRLH